MGKGDSKTRKGKIKSGSYGKSRPHLARVKKPLPAKIKKASEPKTQTAPEMTEKPVTNIKKSHAKEESKASSEDKKIATA